VIKESEKLTEGVKRLLIKHDFLTVESSGRELFRLPALGCFWLRAVSLVARCSLKFQGQSHRFHPASLSHLSPVTSFSGFRVLLSAQLIFQFVLLSVYILVIVFVSHEIPTALNPSSRLEVVLLKRAASWV
jgi:hypothetical protein